MVTRESEPLTLLNRMLEMYRGAHDMWRPVTMQRLENYEMVIGKQWKKADYEMLLRNRRSADVYNFILPIILALSGSQKVNRQTLRAFPIGNGDELTADVITKAIRWSFQQCDKDFQFSRAFLDAVIGRIGWMKSFWSEEWDPEGMWYTDWHDPLRIIFDPETQGDFHRTCNWLFDSPWLPGEAIVKLYAGDNEDLAGQMQEQITILEGRINKSGSGRTLSWRDRFSLMFNVAKIVTGGERELTEAVTDDWMDVRNGMYRVLELHEKRIVQTKTAFDTFTGHSMVIPQQYADDREVLRILTERNPDLRIISNSETQHFVSTVIPAFSANPVAAAPQDMPYDVQCGMYYFTPISCYDFHPDIMQGRSVVDALKDPQQAYNKLESTLKDYIIRHVGHGYVIEDGSITGHEEDWTSREVGINRTYLNGKSKPEPDIPSQIPREVVIGKADHRETMRLISAVPLNYGGETQTSNEASSLFAQRIQQAGLMQSTLLDSARRADRSLGRLALHGLQKNLKEERWIRVVDDEGNPESMVLNQQTVAGIRNNISVGRYDCEIDSTSYSVTAKQEAFMQSLALVKMLPPPLVPWHLLLKNSDIPDKQEWIQWIQQRLGIMQSNGVPSDQANAMVLQELMRAAAAGRARGPVGFSGEQTPAFSELDR